MTGYHYTTGGLNLSTTWRKVVGFATWPHYPQRKRLQYRLVRRLGGPQSQSGCCREANIKQRNFNILFQYHFAISGDSWNQPWNLLHTKLVV
jgi:hypothetical protein